METVKEQINDQLTQGGSTETNHLTQADINNLVLKVKLVCFTFFKILCFPYTFLILQEIHIIKGHRFGFGTLPDPGQVPPSASFMSNLNHEEQLRIANEKIAIADEKIC